MQYESQKIKIFTKNENLNLNYIGSKRNMSNKNSLKKNQFY